MKFTHHDLEFEIDDKWFEESGMGNFAPGEDSFKPDISLAKGQEVIYISIKDVAPLKERAICRGVFCDDEGNTAKERVVRIFDWFKNNVEIEPISVAELENNDKYKYKVLAGSHRFHCSIVAGFTKIPATIGIDIDA